ncbi:phage terminase large subunit-like protein [Luteococcus japonicus]|uniref:Phage terminase large subunit-like protein n=1 Tax=Luteococcus japonicus TaxID=33984 RepID=A0A3N1ZQV2_9ACTN|nr:phage terminase large subunit-like protein [Luteococcus japonicus]
MAGLRAGAKTAITAEPLDFTGWPTDRAERRVRFVEQFVMVTKGVGAGEPFKLRIWQKEIITGAFAPGRRSALVSLPRANGKSALAAALAVAELFCGPSSAEVLVVASDQRQASIVFNLARRMIEMNPELAERTQIYKDRIVVPENDATMMALPADPSALHGWDPSLLIVDELHVVTEDVWEAVTSVSGKRPESLVLAISTPATSSDSVMWKLVQHGRDETDPSFFLKEFSAPDGCAIDDREAWRQANPALGDFLTEDGLASVMKTMREPNFRILRLGQWTKGTDAWLPFGAWADCAAEDERVVGPRERVCLGFDGSASGDSTALVGCTIGERPHLFVVGLWENPGKDDWRVPRAEVDRAIRKAFEDFNVVELACDFWGWRSEIETWAKRHGARRVIEYDTSYRKRMCPATDKFYAAVMDQNLTHDGNEDLAAHMAHAHVTATPQGDAIVKQKRMSARKIDLAIAAIVAHDRATNTTTTKRRRSVGFV